MVSCAAARGTRSAASTVPTSLRETGRTRSSAARGSHGLAVVIVTANRIATFSNAELAAHADVATTLDDAASVCSRTQSPFASTEKSLHKYSFERWSSTYVLIITLV